MRRSEKQIQDNDEIQAILASEKVCRLAMIDGDKPYIVPMNYGLSGETLYFHSAGKGRKIEILKKNPSVCFETESGVELASGEKACDWGCRFSSVIGWGNIFFVEDPEEKRKALDIIMKHQTGSEKWEYSTQMIKRTTVMSLTITKITGKKSG